MTWWHRLLRRRRLESQLDKELRFHLDLFTNDLISRGVEPGEACRQARIALGGPEQVKEDCRDARGTRWLEDLWQDLRYAVRSLIRERGFAVVAILVLAIGIGATTAIFSAVNPILFEPLPYPQSRRIATVRNGGAVDANFHVAFGTFHEIADRSRSFDSAAAFKTWQPTTTVPASPERLEGQRVSAGYFRVLGVAPALGRNLDPSDDRPHGPPVVILSDGLWRRRFQADPAILGRQINLDDVLYTVVAVMPRTFENVLAPKAEIWTALQYDALHFSNFDTREWGNHLRMIARLRAGIGVVEAQRELTAIANTRLNEYPRAPWNSLRAGLLVSSLRDELTSRVRPALLAIIGAVLLVLLIACVNVMNLLLARGAQRTGEFAMRAALGASRPRMTRQMLTETILLAVFGGSLGLLLAGFGVRAVVALSPPELPRIGAIEISSAVFLFALGVTTLAGLAVGLVPALQASRNDLQTSLQQNSRRSTGGRRKTRSALVVAEVAVALVLLVSSGLLLRSLARIFAVAPGFNASHLLTMQVQTTGRRLRTDAAKYRFYSDSLDAVRRIPGVTAAAFTSQLPLSGETLGIYGVSFGPDAIGGVNDKEPAFRYAVSPGYIECMGIPLRAGRLLDDHDRPGSPAVVLINESFAKRKFQGGDAIGKRIRVGDVWATVAGVVADVKQTSLTVAVEDAFYMSFLQGWFADDVMTFVVRTQGDASAMVDAVRHAVWSVEKDQVVTEAATMDDLVAKSAAQRRFALTLFEAFGLVALVLAAAGIYGVLSGNVAERTREIGVRSALGASRGEILGLVIRQAMKLTVLGVLIGLGGAVVATRALMTLLFGVSRLDPLTYLGVVALLMAVSAAACWLPAWRAARVDPAITLRME